MRQLSGRNTVRKLDSFSKKLIGRQLLGNNTVGQLDNYSRVGSY